MRYAFTELELAGNKQVRDARALLDLLNEHSHTQVAMTFTRAKAGRGNETTKRFTIPTHALLKGETYLFYYVIHEFTHCSGYTGHGRIFKTKEKKLLNLFGIQIDYAKAYPKALYSNGERIYTRS